MTKYIYVNSGITAQDELDFELQLPPSRIVDKYASLVFGDIDGFRKIEQAGQVRHFDFEHCKWELRVNSLFLVNSNTLEYIEVNF